MARNTPDIVPLEAATSDPYATILAYPRPEASVLSARIRQLRELGITELEFTGRLRLGRLSLLGKGVAGVVVAGRAGSDKVALKIRRTDSRRASVRHEASMLRAANAIDVGPKYYDNTNDILLMEFVEGQSLPQWITTLRGRGRRLRFRRTAADLFHQCLRMDIAGLDHGELSRAHKNISVTVTGRAVILDFESASEERSPSNLTSIAQYIFLGSGFAKQASRIAGPTDKQSLKRSLREYKLERSADSFHEIESLLSLS